MIVQRGSDGNVEYDAFNGTNGRINKKNLGIIGV